MGFSLVGKSELVRDASALVDRILSHFGVRSGSSHFTHIVRNLVDSARVYEVNPHAREALPSDFPDPFDSLRAYVDLCSANRDFFQKECSSLEGAFPDLVHLGDIRGFSNDVVLYPLAAKLRCDS